MELRNLASIEYVEASAPISGATIVIDERTGHDLRAFAGG
jgi:hypothetical protein